MNYYAHTQEPSGNARAAVARSLVDYMRDTAAPVCHLRNIVAHMAGLEPLGTAERDMRAQMELLRGEPLLGAAIVPWGLMASRTLGAGTGRLGGFLVGVDELPMQDALRGDSAILAAGAQAFDNLVGQASVPRLSSKPALSWISEGGAGAANDAGLGSVSMTPRTLLGRITASVALLKNPSAEDTLRTILRRGCAEAFDSAAIGGAGGAQPLGVLNTSGVTTASGTTLSYSSIWTQVEALLTAGARVGDLFAVAGPTAGRILATRERAAGSGYIIDGGRIGGVVPVAVTANVPASTLVLGVATQLAVGVWGAGAELRSSQSSGFATAQIDLRISLVCDVAVLNPSAFCVFATVT